jgi:hypothetical protein
VAEYKHPIIVTTQAPDTIILCGHRVYLTQLGYLPTAHPAVIELCYKKIR